MNNLNKYIVLQKVLSGLPFFIHHTFSIETYRKRFKILLLSILFPLLLTAQYHPSNNNGSAIATGLSQSNISRLNTDIRNFNYSCAPGANNCSPFYVVGWDGSNPNIFWSWDDGTSGTSYTTGNLSLSSTAIGVDLAILYDNSILDAPYLAVVYAEFSSNQSYYDNVVFELYEYDPVGNSFALIHNFSTSCNMAIGNFPSIDADCRGFFAVAWENNGDLNSFAGKLKVRTPPNPYIELGIVKTITIPSVSGCTEIQWPDVALYGKNTSNTSNYIYYSYQLCNQTKIFEQTQNFNDVYNGSSPPASIYSQYSYTAPGNAVFGPQRIASNEYFSYGNGADLNEFTIVAELEDVDGSSNYLSSIVAMISLNVSGSIETAEYNLNSNYYSGGGVSDFFMISGGNHYTTVENILGFAINNRPAVAYDKDNDHVVITWNMTYNQSAWSSSFPIGGFPAQVYANPDYDNAVSSSDPSKQSLFGTLCNFNSIDNSAANNTSNGSIYVAVSSHNMNEMVYAWMDGNGDIRTRVVISGAVPRLETSNPQTVKLVYPNPVGRLTQNITLSIRDNEEYICHLFNSVGETLFSSYGKKSDLEKQILTVLKARRGGVYPICIFNNAGIQFKYKITFIE